MDFKILSSILLILLAGTTAVWGGRSVCMHSEYSENHSSQKILFCDHGCCGEDENQECCDPPKWNIWLILAISILGFVAVVVIVTVIIAVIKSKNAKRSRVNEADQTNRTNIDNTRREQQRGGSRTNPQAERIEMSAFDRINLPPIRQPSGNPDSVFNNSFERHPPPRPPTYTTIDPMGVNQSIASPPPAYAMWETGGKSDKKHDQWGKDMDL